MAISRRIGFINIISGLVATAALTLPLATSGAQAAEPKKGGSVSITLESDLPSLDPLSFASYNDRNAGLLMYDLMSGALGGYMSCVSLSRTTLAFAAHKFHGPVGIGGLLVRGGAPLAPIMQGGFQQFGLRPGTESAPLVIGLQVALAAALRDAKERRAHLAALRDRFESAILATYPAVIQGRTAERLPHVSNLAFVGLDRRQLAMALDLADVACSTGSACASGSSEPSPVLQAMQCDRQIVDSALRFSFGVENTMTEVDEAIRRVLRVVEQLAPGQG